MLHRGSWVSQELHYEHDIPGFQVLFVVGPRRPGDTAADSRLMSMLDLAHDVHASRMFLFTTVDRVRLEQPADIVRERIWFSPRNDDVDPIPLLDEAGVGATPSGEEREGVATTPSKALM